MKTETNSFFIAGKDASSPFPGICAAEETSFAISEAIAGLYEITPESREIIWTSFNGTLDEFKEFCGAYKETDNRICVIRSPRNLRLAALPEIYEKCFQKCLPDTSVFNTPCMNPDIKELTVIWFKEVKQQYIP